LTISCVDTLKARIDIAGVLKSCHRSSGNMRDNPVYHMDFGNSRFTRQVVLSTIGKVKQPSLRKFRAVDSLPMVTDEFLDLLETAELTDNTPSCSLAEALTKQDLFINSALANLGASLLWQLFRRGMLTSRGFFHNL
jgi:PRTRC genetic system ThiF family protein